MINHLHYRRPETPQKVKLQERDRTIFSLLLEHRLMSSAQLQALLGTQDALPRRLKLLWRAGYLERLNSLQLKFEDNYHHLIYTLAPKALTPLTHITGEKLNRIRWVMKRDQVSGPYLRHALKISEFYTALTLALRPQQAWRLIHWQQGREIHLRFKQGPNSTIRPDALLILSGPDQEPKGFFLEMDNATIREAKMLERYKRYWQFWKAKGHSRFKLDSFRVLTICPNPTRVQNLRVLSRHADDEQRGSGMFLFAHQQWSATNSASVLSPIWRSPKDNSALSLLEL
jgi:hypothetical protein